jgi:FkbM family methyltransferase
MARKWIANYFPMLGKYKRYAIALFHSFQPMRKSYSQHQEDVFVLETLMKYNLARSLYVDTGANHPTDISNTYLLYRSGMKGVVIEPNPELIALFHRFRKRDIALMIGCGSRPALSKFNISKTPVVSSFIAAREANFYKSIHVPVLPLDIALLNIDYEYISFLSIDVEGLNVQVLQGASEILKKTLLLCLEYDSDQEKKEFASILGDNFVLINEFGCNLIYMNSQLSNQYLIATKE